MMEKICNELPSKEVQNFKQLVKLYDSKQYKKGIKQADLILKNLPNHPETLSLKGLFYTLTDKKDEGEKMVKAALMKNLKSGLSWHIQGIFYRNQKNYAQASKSYNQAHKIDPENIQILRDLICLQVQVRDMIGHQASRLKLLQSNPKQDQYWLGYAVSLHLCKEYKKCREVLESFWKIKKENDDLKKNEKNELILYEAMIIEQSGDKNELLKFLKKNEKLIIEKDVFYQNYAKCLMDQGQEDKAVAYIEKLLEINPENYDTVKLLLKCLKITDSVKISDFFDDLLKKYPQSGCLRKNQLFYCQGETFKQKFSAYIKSYFQNGKPSLFKEIQLLYSDQDKVHIIEDIMIQNEKCLSNESKFYDLDEKQNPCCLLWNYMFLAQHYCKLNQLELSQNYIDKAIKHTPTLIELYLIKAKIYKKSYQYQKAFDQANYARNMDLADRYLNNKTIKYALKNNDTVEAENLLKSFMKHEVDSNAYELQTQWYILNMGIAYLKKNEYGGGLRHLKYIEAQFNEIYDDQFDFHTYSFRKYTLKQYWDLIHFEDNIYGSKNYIKGMNYYINGLIQYNINQKEYSIPEISQDEVTKKLDLNGQKYLTELKDVMKEASNIAKVCLDIKKPKDTNLGIKLYSSLVHLFCIEKKPDQALLALQKLVDLKGQNENDLALSKHRAFQAVDQFVAENSGKNHEKLIQQLKEIESSINQISFKQNSLISQIYQLVAELSSTNIKQFQEKSIEILNKSKPSSIKESIEILDLIRQEIHKVSLISESKNYITQVCSLFQKLYPSCTEYK